MGRPKPLTNVQKAKLLSDHSGLKHVPRPADASVWIGGYGLGSGSYGEVSLWICLDEKTRKPVRECAIKDVFDTRPTEEKGIYKDIYHSLVAKGMDFGADPWTEYLGQARVDKRFYKEAYLQGIMTEHDSKQEIYSVPLWGYRRKKESLRPDFNHWRLYMSLYDYGDLYNVIYAHLVKQKGIPEPFIWHTIRCLLIGSEQLSDLPKKLEGATDSDVIVVFDMKPENILLAPPNQMSTFPTYPRPHIADLGGACLTNLHDPSNFTGRYDCQMTEGYHPPEMARNVPYKDGRMPCGEWTNVWQIGRVAEAMMKLALQFDELPYHPSNKSGDMEPEILNWRGDLPGQDYSMELRRVIASCTRFDPRKRNNARDIINVIETNPAFLYNLHAMHTFGNDAWFEEQERKQAEKAASEPPGTTTPPTPSTAAAQEAAETKKRKRMDDAYSYLRSWDGDKRARFMELEVLPDEKFDLEYNGNQFWATDDKPLVDENGDLFKSYAFERDNGLIWLKGHTSSVGLDRWRSTSSGPVVEGGEDDDAADGDEDGENDDDDGEYDEDGDDGGYSYHSSQFPPLWIPSQLQGTADAGDQGGGGNDDSYHHHSSDFPWLTDPFGRAEEDVDEPEDVDDDQEEEDDGEDGSGSAYYSAASEVWHSMSSHGPEDYDDQEEEDEDEDADMEDD